MSKLDYLIVGSGLYGAVFARLATDRGYKCLVIEKRSHIGGNVYCENIEGINVHKYGAHIFHTSNKRVWDFVNSFVEFNRFTNCPIANYQGELYNLPFNMHTFNKMWNITTPEEAIVKITQQKEEVIQKMHQAGQTEPQNLEEQALTLVGKDIYEKLIKGYTEKQWGRKCTELPPFIIRRLPVRFIYDNNYFNDAYQGIPIGGYNKLINKLLEGIEVKTSTNFFDNRALWEKIAKKILFTGKIDEFYNYQYGKLEYRTVRFEHEIIDSPNYQGNAVMNYTEREVPYTRIIEHKHFEMFGEEVYTNPKTVISREYSTEWADGSEPFYPVNDTKNTTLYEKYKALAKKEKHIIFGGRLAEYKYYDMAPIIEQVLNMQI